jgi:hypothetical protein
MVSLQPIQRRLERPAAVELSEVTVSSPAELVSLPFACSLLIASNSPSANPIGPAADRILWKLGLDHYNPLMLPD